MNFEKFICMLMDGGVYFSNPGTFRDPYEGSLPIHTVDRLSKWQDEEQGTYIAEVVSEFNRKRHVVSCWHELEHESDAMWRLYTGTGAGIAIKTDFGSLKNALFGSDESPDICMAGKVKYVDYEREDIPVLNGMSLFYKRKTYSHEHEVRFVYPLNENDAGSGKNFKADLGELIHAVVLLPDAKDWEINVVRETARKFNESLAPSIRKSEIAKPTYLEDFMRE